MRTSGAAGSGSATGAGVTGAATGAGNVPVNTAGALLKEALNYALTANPGGVKSKCVLGYDQAAATVALPYGNRMYWRDFTQA